MVEDVPPYILDMIYEKDGLDCERRMKRKAPSLESDRPIKIVNVMPSPYGQTTAEGCTPPPSAPDSSMKIIWYDLYFDSL
ncbi:hypothetical protein IL306_004704 [Fusarium sp. DS 682]|nr:hypothetical protein IL306_004704 [Fusarium sp. DS 682]